MVPDKYEDGSAAFFTNREVAWHKLGIVTPNALTAEEALRTAQLDWQVIKTDKPVGCLVPTKEGTGAEMITFEDKFMTYRYHPKHGKAESLGVVGNRYTPVQNLEAFSFLNYVADESGAVFETAGSMNNGRKVFMTMKMPEGLQIGGQDAIDLYLMAWNTHDGTSAFNVLVTPIRVVCQNTLSIAIRNAKSSYSLRHTPNVSGKIQAAREALGITFKYTEEFEKMAESLISQDMTDKEFARLVEKVFPLDEESQRAKTMAENARDIVLGLWKAPTQANIANTKWAAYNAFTEYSDWASPLRGKNQETLRAERIITGAGDRFKNKVLALL